jgi:tyrosyl-tRNA synthetase
MTGMASSNSEARRLVSQGGVSVDGRRITDVNELVTPGHGIVLKVGKRKFLKVRTNEVS